jgi:hypothetical protein
MRRLRRLSYAAAISNDDACVTPRDGPHGERGATSAAIVAPSFSW